MAGGERSLAQRSRLVTSEHLEHLEREGYAIVDGFLGEEWAVAVRDEIRWLHDKQLMFPNQVSMCACLCAPMYV